MAGMEDRLQLSQRPPKTTSLMATQAHPQRDLLFKAIHPADTLEEWMEKGLHRVEDEESVWLEGFAVLPIAYKGCNKESLLVMAPQVKTQVYPLPFEIVEETDGKMRMLYHYTYRSSFEFFVRIFASALDEKQRVKLKAEQATDEEEEGVPSVSTLVLRQIQADWNDRSQRNVTSRSGTRVPDPELLLSEPGKFSNRQALNQALVGISKPGGTTASGQKLSELGDFCVAVKAPSSVLVPCNAANGKPGAMRVQREAVKTLEQQRLLRLAHQAQQALDEQKEKEKRRRAQKTCLGRLCGGGQAPALWDEEVDKEDTMEGDGRTNRKKREVDQLKAERLKTWTKEHFIAIQDKQREKEAEDLGQEQTEEKSRLEQLVMESRRWLRQALGLKEIDDGALHLYHQHMEKEAAKKSAVGALEKLKSRKANTSRPLVRSLHSSKTRAFQQRIRQEDLQGNYDDENEIRETDKDENAVERSPEKKPANAGHGPNVPEDVPELEQLDVEVEEETKEKSRFKRFVSASRRWFQRAIGLKEEDAAKTSAMGSNIMGRLEKLKLGKSPRSQALINSLSRSKRKEEKPVEKEKEEEEPPNTGQEEGPEDVPELEKLEEVEVPDTAAAADKAASSSNSSSSTSSSSSSSSDSEGPKEPAKEKS